MKNFILLYLTVLFVSNYSFASEKATLSVEISRFGTSDNYVLNVTSETASNIVVKISNSIGQAIFSEMIQDVEQYYKVYNLSTLPKGDYTILVDNKQSIFTEKITVNQLSGSHNDLGKSMVVGFSKLRDLKLSVVIQNKSLSEVEITLYTQTGKQIKVITTTKQAISKQQLDLSSLKSGNYKIKISDGKSIFSKEITITR